VRPFRTMKNAKSTAIGRSQMPPPRLRSMRRRRTHAWARPDMDGADARSSIGMDMRMVIGCVLLLFVPGYAPAVHGRKARSASRLLHRLCREPSAIRPYGGKTITGGCG